jgi:tRNA pseudouridine38-40 synthase
LLPNDVWVAAAWEMQPAFHARYSATARRYSYYVGLDEEAASPFRRDREYALHRDVDRQLLDTAACLIMGTHLFRGFAVKGTAPQHDDHRCDVRFARWTARTGGLHFEIEANRFLHHMVRFLVGTMLDVATGRRAIEDVRRLLEASDNTEVSPPAPPHALFLDAVEYPADLYLSPR